MDKFVKPQAVTQPDDCNIPESDDGDIDEERNRQKDVEEGDSCTDLSVHCSASYLHVFNCIILYQFA